MYVNYCLYVEKNIYLYLYLLLLNIKIIYILLIINNNYILINFEIIFKKIKFKVLKYYLIFNL